jgi:hypothetical protein
MTVSRQSRKRTIIQTMTSSSPSHFMIATTLVYAILALASHQATAMSMLAGHYHHNKRQQSGLSPTLTLDVEPHPGLTHSYVNHTPITEYYFPVDSGILNFTCTIKHPSFKYKLTMVREQVFNSKFLILYFEENRTRPKLNQLSLPMFYRVGFKSFI